jgi:hypothetical protein
MTPSPQSIDRVVLPTDSTIPIARSTEYDTYFRTARSRSSSEYFVGAPMTLILPCHEGLHQARCDSVPSSRLTSRRSTPSRLAPSWR